MVDGRWPEDVLGPRSKASGVMDVKKCVLGTKGSSWQHAAVNKNWGHRLVSSIYIPHEDLVATKVLIRRAWYYTP